MIHKTQETQRIKAFFLALSAFALVSCPGFDNSGCDSPSAPTPPTTTTTTIPPEPAPRVDQPFSWSYYQGFTAFALGHPGQDADDIHTLFADAMSHGWNTARVCAETEFWDGDAHYPKKMRDLARLQWTLDIIARIHGAQVLLIGNCTLKGPVHEGETRLWAKGVAQVVTGRASSNGPWGSIEEGLSFSNVAVETHNEFDNCGGRGWGPHCPGKQDVRAHVEIYRAAGIQYVTADDSLCYGPNEAKTYQFRLANIGAWPPDFHPCRDKGREPWDPNDGFLHNVVRYNGTPFVLSETVAWMDYSGNCAGLRTCDKERIQRYINTCAAVHGCRFTYHSENLLAGESPTWWPEAR